MKGQCLSIAQLWLSRNIVLIWQPFKTNKHMVETELTMQLTNHHQDGMPIDMGKMDRG